MMVYPDDLNFRAISSIGWDMVTITENDAGRDGANHDFDGIFIFKGNGILPKKEKRLSIFNITPTVLNRMKIPIPDDLTGNIII